MLGVVPNVACCTKHSNYQNKTITITKGLQSQLEKRYNYTKYVQLRRQLLLADETINALSFFIFSILFLFLSTILTLLTSIITPARKESAKHYNFKRD